MNEQPELSDFHFLKAKESEDKFALSVTLVRCAAIKTRTDAAKNINLRLSCQENIHEKKSAQIIPCTIFVAFHLPAAHLQRRTALFQ